MLVCDEGDEDGYTKQLTPRRKCSMITKMIKRGEGKAKHGYFRQWVSVTSRRWLATGHLSCCVDLLVLMVVVDGWSDRWL